MILTAWDCLWFLHFSVHSFLLFMLRVSVLWFSSGSVELRHLPPLKFLFFFSFLTFLSKMTKRAPEPASPSDSNSISTSSPVPSSSPVPPPSTSFYKFLYHWALSYLLEETSTFTFIKSIVAYRKKQTCHPSRIFGKECDKFVRVVACREGEPVCSNEASDLALLLHLFHHFLKVGASITPYSLRTHPPNRGERSPCPTTSQQLGIRKGFCHSLLQPWPYAIFRHLPFLLQRGGWEGALNALPAVIQGIQEEFLQNQEQLVGPCPSRWVSLVLDRETHPSEAPKSLGSRPSRARGMRAPLWTLCPFQYFGVAQAWVEVRCWRATRA